MRMNKTEDGGLRSTGISRPVDELGRIVLPVELRRSLDIKEGDRMAIYTAGNSIVLKKATPRCAVCGIEKYELHQLGNCHICTVCAKRIAVMTEGVWT